MLLSGARRELQELKSSLRKLQREREEQADKKATTPPFTEVMMMNEPPGSFLIVCKICVLQGLLNSGPWLEQGSGTGPEVDSSGGATGE